MPVAGSGLFSGSGSSGLFQGSSSGASSGHHAHGVGGFLENLGSDVKNATVGFIPGTVHLVEHPVASIEEMGKATWQTWSPLFHGNFGKFGHNVYDHPLTPILDVATIFDLGLGTAGKLGEMTGADEGTLLGRAAGLTKPKTIDLKDPTGASRIVPVRSLSTRPLRRLYQEKVSPTIKGQTALAQGGSLEDLSSLQRTLTTTSFEKAAKADIARRVIGRSAIMTSLLKVGKTLSEDTPESIKTRRTLAEGAHQNLFDHGNQMTPEQAVAQLQTRAGQHMRPVEDPSLTRMKDHTNRIQALQNTLRKRTLRAASTADLAHALPKLQDELERQESQLKDMNEKGYRIVMPAQTKLKEPTDRQLMERNAAPRVEVQQNIKRLRKQIDKASKAKIVHDKAVSDIETFKPQLLDLQKTQHEHYFDQVSSSAERFDDFSRNLGKYAVVNRARGRSGKAITAKEAASMVSRAMVDQNGRVSLVPVHDTWNLGHELNNSTTMLKMLWRKPTRAWKMAVVGYTPRTIVNNSIGNLMIYMMRENPMTGIWGLWNGYRLSGDINKASTALFDTSTKSGILRKFFGPDMHNVYGHEELELAGKGGRFARLKSGAYPLVHRLADIPVRSGAILAYLRRDPLVKQYMDTGLSFEKAADRALHEDPTLKMRASDHATAIGGDYVTVGPGMRKVMDIAPFALWDRHILRSTSNLIKDTPGRAAVAQQLSDSGDKEVTKLLGSVPSYLAGALPLSMLGLGSAAGERTNVLTTSSLDPFSTIGDLADTAQALTVGHSPDVGGDLFSQVNPFISGMVSFATGQGLGGGAVQKHGGAIPSILVNTLQGIPEYRVAQGMLETPTTVTKKGKEKLYKTGETPAVTSFLGVPVRNVGKQAAQAASDEEKGVKKGRKKKSGLF